MRGRHSACDSRFTGARALNCVSSVSAAVGNYGYLPWKVSGVMLCVPFRENGWPQKGIKVFFCGVFFLGGAGGWGLGGWLDN